MRDRNKQLSAGSVAIRMYRDMLGDCFLLRIPQTEGAFHILIDCGILQGTPDAASRATRIMSDIRRQTNRIDVLIVTHEHWDHLSGFEQAAEEFASISVGELWLAWTEDRRDEQARRLREGREQAMRVIDRSFTALTGLLAPDFDPDAAEEEELAPSSASMPLDGLTGLMAFVGAEQPGNMLLAAERTTSILDRLRAKAESVKFLSPGGPVIRPMNSDALSVYVLGPPRNEKMLKRSRPSKRGGEVYELAGDGAEVDMFLVAALAPVAGVGMAHSKLGMPFAARELIANDATGVRAEGIHRSRAKYNDPDAEWRRIDTDWLGAAETLALRLDADTNNTSLALALELRGGKVLLFPGDAQVGSWLSWGDHVWPPEAKPSDAGSITAEKLLARTVVYKVGHHGSHNATLRERGLELMNHPGLVAFVPVDERFARDVKKWNMPFPSLNERLEQKTGGRVIRGDRGKDFLVTEARQRSGKAGELSRSDWDAFLNDVYDIKDEEGMIAIEYHLHI
ncbi:MBL fold metallo-hydrolase [Bradyrhizobium elkanii]|uniref:MBL fold metallo-hydrolase n=1 Tax=Bradyrhizobium elkanii TaxID=29448 RepID=A0A4U6RXY0_BRAEL|nr:MBL fold metallo-hydrolase [Bradyrhizobium elkanii]TKV80099.1 MBL fold metallo-hydrolase [Bradyrhizobium elkanii]